MAITTPKGEQIQFVSAKTGTHNLDTYLEAAEVGNRQLHDLLDDMFDASTGVFKADNFQFRFDTSTDKLQVRVGQFANSTASWTDVTTFFKITGTFSTSTSYNNFDLVTLSTKDVYIVHGLTTATAYASESNFISSANTSKIVDVSAAKEWASKTDGIVDSIDYSAKAYAIGGTGVTDTATKGAAKEWATKTSGTVDGTDYSAKHWATTGNVATVSGAIANINTVAGISGDITSVAGKASLITSDFVSDLNTLAVTDVINDINLLATSDIVSDLNTLATSDIVSDLNTLATSDIISDINLLATSDIVSDLNQLATSDFVSDLNAMATTANINNLNAVAGDATNIGTLATDLSGTNSIGTVAGGMSNVNAVGGAITNVSAVGGSITAVNTVATNISSVNNFFDTYSVSANAPTGAAVTEGDLWFDTTSQILKVRSASGFQNAGSSVNGTAERKDYTASSGQTSFAATYDTSYVDVYLNGVKLAPADFTATNGTAVVLASAASSGDTVSIVSFGTFLLADHYTKTAVGALIDDVETLALAGM